MSSADSAVASPPHASVGPLDLPLDCYKQSGTHGADKDSAVKHATATGQVGATRGRRIGPQKAPAHPCAPPPAYAFDVHCRCDAVVPTVWCARTAARASSRTWSKTRLVNELGKASRRDPECGVESTRAGAGSARADVHAALLRTKPSLTRWQHTTA